MAKLFERVGDVEQDDAIALMERAHSCLDSAMATLEEHGFDRAVERLEIASDAIETADATLR